MGMSYQDYWYGDVWMIVPYVEAHNLKKKQENERLWIQGLYFYNALSVVFERFKYSLSNKTPPDSLQYLAKPIEFEQKEKTPEQLQEQEDREVRMARAYMMQMDAAFKNRS